MVPQSDFVFPQGCTDLPVECRLPLLDICQRSLDLLLDRDVEVKLVQRVQRHHRVQQMGRIETPSTNLLRILEAEKDDLVSVYWTFFYLRGLFCCFLLFHFRRWRLFLVVVNALNHFRLRDALVFLR